MQDSFPTFANFLASIASREINKVYGSQLWVWRPLSFRDNTNYFGRKRRARRARGRAIAAKSLKRSFVDCAIAGSAAGFRFKPIGPTTRFGNAKIPTFINAAFLDPHLGEPWLEEQAQQGGTDEADQDRR